MNITKIYAVLQPVPFIIVETDAVISNDGTGKVDIQFNELSKYVDLFTQQQELLSKYVVATRGTYTERNKSYDAIVFDSTFILPETPIDQTITFYINGVLFQATEGLTAQERCINTNNLGIVRAFYKAALVSFTLPRTNATFEQDYTWTDQALGNASVLCSAVAAIPSSWDVTCCVLSPISAPLIYFVDAP